MKPNPSSRSSSRMLGAALLLLTTGTLACSDLAAESPLSDARRTPEALAEAALDALRERDRDALRALIVSREEYEQLLWPSMPDREQMPFSFVWGIAEPRSRKARNRALSEYGGMPLELVRVELGDEVEAYDAFTLHKEARMTVRNTETGEVGLLPLMDVVVEMRGGWKFLNYREDLPASTTSDDGP